MLRIGAQCIGAMALILVFGCSTIQGANQTSTPTPATSGQYQFVETIDKTNPVEAKIGPMTAWYWCGFKSMKKLHVSVQTTRTVTVYNRDKDDLKKDVKAKGWVVNAGNSPSKKEYIGWYLPYDLCLVIRNDATASDEYAVLEVKVSSSMDNTLILIICGIAAGGLLTFTCLIWCCIKICHKICLRGKKKKGANPV